MALSQEDYIREQIQIGLQSIDTLVSSLNIGMDNYFGPSQEEITQASNALYSTLKRSALYPKARYYIFIELNETGILDLFISEQLYKKLSKGPPKSLVYIEGGGPTKPQPNNKSPARNWSNILRRRGRQHSHSGNVDAAAMWQIIQTVTNVSWNDIEKQLTNEDTCDCGLILSKMLEIIEQHSTPNVHNIRETIDTVRKFYLVKNTLTEDSRNFLHHMFHLEDNLSYTKFLNKTNTRRF